LSAAKRTFWKPALVVFLIALSARAGWGIVRWTREGLPPKLEFPDEQQYWGIAQSLWQGEGLRDELGFRSGRMPLYPALLSPFTSMPNGIAACEALQWLVGALSAAMVTIWTRRWGSGVAVVAGTLVALDPFLVFSSSLLLTETTFIAALIALWWALWRVSAATFSPRDWGLAGSLAGICVYLRESSLGLLLGALIWAVIVHRERAKALSGAALCLLIVAAMLSPWAFRNHRILGQWRWLTTRGGISLYDGVGPQADGGSDLGNIKDSPTVRGMDELERDAYFRREAWNAIRANPARILRLAGTKLARMWNPIPNVDSYQSNLTRLVSAGWVLPVFLLALGGALVLTTRARPDGLGLTLFLLLPAFYLSAVHALFVGSVRYRLPAMPFLEVLAAIALCRAMALFRRSNAGSREP